MKLSSRLSTNSWGEEGRLSLSEGGSRVPGAPQGLWTWLPEQAVLG